MSTRGALHLSTMLATIHEQQEAQFVDVSAYIMYIGSDWLRQDMHNHTFSAWAEVFNFTYKRALQYRSADSNTSSSVFQRMFEWIIVNC